MSEGYLSANKHFLKKSLIKLYAIKKLISCWENVFGSNFVYSNWINKNKKRLVGFNMAVFQKGKVEKQI